MPWFNYNASALALGGGYTDPVLGITPVAACVLPSTGGPVSATAGPVRIPATGPLLMSIESAETRLETRESGTTHTTSVLTAVRGLNVQDVLRASAVIASLKFEYDTATDRLKVDSSGSGYFDLTINGVPFPVPLKHELAAEGADYEAFRKNESPAHALVSVRQSLRTHAVVDECAQHADLDRTEARAAGQNERDVGAATRTGSVRRPPSRSATAGWRTEPGRWPPSWPRLRRKGDGFVVAHAATAGRPGRHGRGQPSIATVLTLTNSRMPWRPSSRP